MDDIQFDKLKDEAYRRGLTDENNKPFPRSYLSLMDYLGIDPEPEDGAILYDCYNAGFDEMSLSASYT